MSEGYQNQSAHCNSVHPFVTFPPHVLQLEARRPLTESKFEPDCHLAPSDERGAVGGNVTSPLESHPVGIETRTSADEKPRSYVNGCPNWDIVNAACHS